MSKHQQEFLAALNLKKLNEEDDQMTVSMRDYLEAGPSGQGEAGPSGQGEAGPSGQGEAGPSGQGEAGPSGQGEAGPSGQGEAGPSGQGEAGPSGQGEADHEGGNNWALSYQQVTEEEENRDLIQALIRNTGHFSQFSGKRERAANLAKLYYKTHSECNATGERPANIPGGATGSKNVPEKLEQTFCLSKKPSQFCDKFKKNNNNIRARGKINRSGDKTPKKNRVTKKQKNDAVPMIQEWVPIGSGNTKVLSDIYKSIKWEWWTYTHATRTLLMAVFGREVLATHSMTGKPSPAFIDKPAKMCLDRNKVSDIIMEVVKKCKVRANRVRQTITIKCADECKMMRTRCKKQASTE